MFTHKHFFWVLIFIFFLSWLLLKRLENYILLCCLHLTFFSSILSKPIAPEGTAEKGRPGKLAGEHTLTRSSGSRIVGNGGLAQSRGAIIPEVVRPRERAGEAVRVRERAPHGAPTEKAEQGRAVTAHAGNTARARNTAQAQTPSGGERRGQARGDGARQDSGEGMGEFRGRVRGHGNLSQSALAFRFLLCTQLGVTFAGMPAPGYGKFMGAPLPISHVSAF